VRMFDLRSLEHSTIIYEPSDKNGDRDKGKSSYLHAQF
jgi:WD repeat-containing protein 68